MYTSIKSKIHHHKIAKTKIQNTLMSQKSFYKIIASPRHRGNIIKKILHNPKKRQVIISILGIYTLVGSLVAISMFSRVEKPVVAYEPALISSTIQLAEDKDFGIGDTVNVSLTLQNTSSEQVINDIDLSLQSTKDIIKWSKVESNGKNLSSKSYKIDNNKTKLDLLSSGERAEYIISGTLSDNQTPLTTVIGNISFTNQEGSQSFSTNKILVNAKVPKAAVYNTLEIKTDKNVYKSDEKISLTLAPKGDFEEKNVQNTVGKVYISNKLTKEVVSDDTCTIDETNSCVDVISALPAGKYSTLFIDKSETKMSVIGQFEVLGKSGNFEPDTNAQLEFPFAESSINGVIPVYARKVVSLNKAIQTGDQCNFEIIKDGNVVSNTKAQVESDGSCHTLLSAAQVPADGIYTIRLGGSNKQKEVSIIKKAEKLLALTNKTLVLTKNKPVEFESKNIQSLSSPTPTPSPLTNSKVSIVILNQTTGEYQEVNNANGDPYKVIDGNLSVTLPGQQFTKGGVYSLYFKTEDNQFSDFTTISFDDREASFASSNVLIDNSDNLKVGKTMVFSVQGLVDRNSNTIAGGECGADIYTANNSIFPILAKGEIKDGNCKVTVAADKITQAGPILVSFTGDDIPNKINQSRQFVIKPGDVSSYGYLNLEYEPARAGYANNVVIGPVTDKKGNLVSANGKKLVIKNGDEIIRQLDSINIENGFARVSLPGSTLNPGDITLTLLDSDDTGTQLISKFIKVIDTDAKLFLPAFPTTISNGEKIKVIMDNVPNANAETVCKLSFIKSDVEYFDGSGVYDLDKNKCIVEFDLDEFRTNPNALLRFQVGDLVYSSIVNIESGVPANLFSMTPQVELAKKDELNISLLSSPIVDKKGKIVTTGKIKTQYNGKVEEIEIKNGVAKFEIDAKKLDTKDINTKLDQKFLELNINAKASVTSISKTNSVSIFMGSKNIATNKSAISPKSAQTQIQSNLPSILAFKSNICSVNIASEDNKIVPTPSHQQGDVCYVEVLQDTGKYTLSFEENGFVKYTFDIRVSPEIATLVWSNQKPLNVEIIGETKADEKVTLYDGENQYKFENKENNGGITINQNGLNPIKDYLLEVTFGDKDGNPVSYYKTVAGEKITK